MGVNESYLDDLVHDDGDEEVEEDGGDVLEAVGVEHHVHVLGAAAGGRRGHRQGHVVVQRDEQRRHRGRDLKKDKVSLSMNDVYFKSCVNSLNQNIDFSFVWWLYCRVRFQDTYLLRLEMS